MQIMIGKKITKSTMCSITLIGSLLLRKRRASLNAVHFNAEELILIHWGDFFRNNFASNISYFKDEHLHELLHERLFNSQSQTWKIPGSIPCIIKLKFLE
jgi:hypothetical protein